MDADLRLQRKLYLHQLNRGCALVDSHQSRFTKRVTLPWRKQACTDLWSPI